MGDVEIPLPERVHEAGEVRCLVFRERPDISTLLHDMADYLAAREDAITNRPIDDDTGLYNVLAITFDAESGTANLIIEEY